MQHFTTIVALIGAPRPTEETLVSKKAVWFGMIVGSTIGGCVPSLWHASMLSMWGIVLSTVGGIAGIWLAYRLTH